MGFSLGRVDLAVLVRTSHRPKQALDDVAPARPQFSYLVLVAPKFCPVIPSMGQPKIARASEHPKRTELHQPHLLSPPLIIRVVKGHVSALHDYSLYLKMRSFHHHTRLSCRLYPPLRTTMPTGRPHVESGGRVRSLRTSLWIP